MINFKDCNEKFKKVKNTGKKVLRKKKRKIEENVGVICTDNWKEAWDALCPLS